MAVNYICVLKYVCAYCGESKPAGGYPNEYTQNFVYSASDLVHLLK